MNDWRTILEAPPAPQNPQNPQNGVKGANFEDIEDIEDSISGQETARAVPAVQQSAPSKTVEPPASPLPPAIAL
jgi:hypothetical protein